MSPGKTVKAAAIAMILAASLLFLTPPPASALDLSEYFQFSYDPVTFDNSQITGSEVFHATVSGRAACTADLPFSPSEAQITSRIVAVHTASGAEVTLNTSYTLTIKPFPSKQGETAEISQDVPLQFPTQAASGTYAVFGRIVEAKVKVPIIQWMDVTGYLPQEQNMGSVQYTAPAGTEPPPTGEPGQSPAAENSPGSAVEPAPATTDPGLSSSPEPSAPGPWWVWPVVTLAVFTTAFNVIWFWRHRR